MHITSNVVISNPANGEVYMIQHYVIKFVSDLQQFGDFLWVSSTNKTGRHYITEMLLKVVLNIITVTPICDLFSMCYCKSRCILSCTKTK